MINPITQMRELAPHIANTSSTERMLQQQATDSVDFAFFKYFLEGVNIFMKGQSVNEQLTE